MRTWKHRIFIGILAILTVIIALIACDNGNGTTHTHDYGTAWKSNATQHWRECSCGDKTDVADHEWEWVETTPATPTADGLETETCKTCGETRGTKPIAKLPPEHTHDYGTAWKSNATQHWRECSCGDKTDVADHEWQWVVTIPATIEADGLETETCSICGATRGTRPISKLPISTMGELTAYLNNNSGGDSPSNPITLTLMINFGDTLEQWEQIENGWQELTETIAETGKYVELNLSACTLKYIPFNSVTDSRDKIISVILPEELEIIDEVAFRGFTNLTQITFPESLTYIGHQAFDGCTSLTQITLPANLTFNNNTTAGMMFRGCTSLVSFNLTGNGSLSVIEGGKALVQNDTELVAYPSATGVVILPEGITAIGGSTFRNNTNLTYITLPASLTTIERYAFYDCNLGITSLAVIPPTMDPIFVFQTAIITQIKVPVDSVEAYKSASGWSSRASVISAIE